MYTYPGWLHTTPTATVTTQREREIRHRLGTSTTATTTVVAMLVTIILITGTRMGKTEHTITHAITDAQISRMRRET